MMDDREIRIAALVHVGLSPDVAANRVDDQIRRGLVSPLTESERTRLISVLSDKES